MAIAVLGYQQSKQSRLILYPAPTPPASCPWPLFKMQLTLLLEAPLSSLVLSSLILSSPSFVLQFFFATCSSILLNPFQAKHVNSGCKRQKSQLGDPAQQSAEGHPSSA